MLPFAGLVLLFPLGVLQQCDFGRELCQLGSLCGEKGQRSAGLWCGPDGAAASHAAAASSLGRTHQLLLGLHLVGRLLHQRRLGLLRRHLVPLQPLRLLIGPLPLLLQLQGLASLLLQLCNSQPSDTTLRKKVLFLSKQMIV